MRHHLRTLPVAFAAVFAVSFYAWGTLGGAAGIDVPFTGFLQDGAAAMNDSAVDLTFEVFDSAGAGAYCAQISTTVEVVDGRFSTVIPNISESCVKRKDPHVEVLVDKDQNGGDVRLVGRQRLFPALGAYTSGGGDLDVQSNLTVGGSATVTGDVTAANATLSNTLTTQGLTVNGGSSLSGTTSAQRLYINENSDDAEGFRLRNGAALASNTVQISMQSLQNQAYSSINFNGSYSGGEVRVNGAKNRWRMFVDQRGASDNLSIDRYDGTGSTSFNIDSGGNVALRGAVFPYWTVCPNTASCSTTCPRGKIVFGLGIHGASVLDNVQHQIGTCGKTQEWMGDCIDQTSCTVTTGCASSSIFVLCSNQL